MSTLREDVDRALFALERLGPNDVAVNEALNIYVNAALGDDANDGSAEHPLATLIEAEQRIPYQSFLPVFLWVYPHPGDGYEAPTFRARLCVSNIYMVGVGETELLSGTITTNSNLTHTVSVPTGADDVLRGKTLEILSGARATERRTLHNNTGTTLKTLTSTSSAVGAGAQFRVFEPQVAIKVTASSWILSEGIGSGGASTLGMNRQSVIGLVLVNLAIDAVDTVVNFAGTLILFGIEVRGAATSITFAGLNGSSALYVGADVPIQLDGICARTGPILGANSNSAWGAWGLSFTGGTYLHITDSATYVLGVNAQRLLFWNCPAARLYAFRLSDGLRVVSEPGPCNVFVSTHTTFFGDSNTSVIESAVSPVVQVTGLDANLTIDCTLISTANGTCLQVRRGGRAYLTQTPTYTAGTGVGIEVVHGSSVNAFAVPTITATTPIRVGLATPVTGVAGDLSVVGAHISHADGSSVRRVN